MSENKTHYRKAFNSPYLSSQDIVEPTILTITRVTLEPDQTKKTKDYFNTAHFSEKELRPGEALKPMILNATNSRSRDDMVGSLYIDAWKNTPVTIYVDPIVRCGRDSVEGLRISTESPKKKSELLPDTPAWNRAIASYREFGNLDAVLPHVTITEANRVELIKIAQTDVA